MYISGLSGRRSLSPTPRASPLGCLLNMAKVMVFTPSPGLRLEARISSPGFGFMEARRISLLTIGISIVGSCLQMQVPIRSRRTFRSTAPLRPLRYLMTFTRKGPARSRRYLGDCIYGYGHGFRCEQLSHGWGDRKGPLQHREPFRVRIRDFSLQSFHTKTFTLIPTDDMDMTLPNAT